MYRYRQRDVSAYGSPVCAQREVTQPLALHGETSGSQASGGRGGLSPSLVLLPTRHRPYSMTHQGVVVASPVGQEPGGELRLQPSASHGRVAALPAKRESGGGA